MLTAIFVAGLLMGLASSLHCAGMCGPIACSLLLVQQPRRNPLVTLLLAQGGRVFSYVLLGMVFGLFGAGLYGVANLQAAHAVLQYSAALTIIWTGLAIAQLVPAMAGLDRLFLPLAASLTRLRMFVGATGSGGVVLAGMLWGATPCAMVYTALFNSLLSGSVDGGMTMMAGFGLGTLTAVTLAGLGLFRLSRVGATKNGRLAAGLGLAATGILALLLTSPASPFCITGG